jgi:hypothetical protein
MDAAKGRLLYGKLIPIQGVLEVGFFIKATDLYPGGIRSHDPITHQRKTIKGNLSLVFKDPVSRITEEAVRVCLSARKCIARVDDLKVFFERKSKATDPA